MKRASLLLVALALSCGPTRRPQPSFVVVVHSVVQPPGPTELMTLRWWGPGSNYAELRDRQVEPSSDEVFALEHVTPDLVELETVAWTGYWTSADFAGHWVLHVVYPTRATWLEVPMRGTR